MSVCLTAVAATPSAPLPMYYGKSLCADTERYRCIRVARGETWDSLFPNEEQRDIVQRINRTSNYLWLGKELAVPLDLAHANVLDYAPFERHVPNIHEKTIIVDQDKLAWAAYDEQGNLLKWGPVSSGRNKCPDSANKCLTLTGIYRVFSKENEKCISDVFPIGRGGAKMPYCMFFHKGFALHGSDDIPGFRASHGCIRLFTRDAKWLNQEFVQAGNDTNGFLGTKVVVRPVKLSERNHE